MCVITEQPRGAASSSFNGLPLTRPAAADEYKVRDARTRTRTRSLRALTLTLTRAASLTPLLYDRINRPSAMTTTV